MRFTPLACRSSGLALALASLAALACGCSRVGGDGGGSHETVRFSIGAEPASLDPLLAHVDAGGTEDALARLCFAPLLDVDAAGELVSALASTVPTPRNGGVSADGRTITYRLRRAVWSDGVAVDANDVLFTLRAILDARNPVGSREGYALVDGARAIGPRTVALHLREPWSPAVATLFASALGPRYVLPAHAPRDATTCDGPYVLASRRRGAEIVYRANPRFYGGKPALAGVRVSVVADPNTNLTLLRSGRLDFNLLAPVQQAALAGTDGLAFREVPTTLVAGLALNTGRGPLADPRLRRALAGAIDRVGISRKITLGRYPLAESDRPRFSWAYDAGVREPAYDPQAADRAFDAAGWPRGADGMRRRGGTPLTLTYVQFPESATGVRVATAVQAELRARGVAVAIKSISNAQLFLPAREGGLLARGAFDLAYVPWSVGVDPDDRALYACAGAQNYMRWCDPRVDALEREAVRTNDRAARAAAYRAIDRLVAREVPVLWLFNPRYLYAVRADLHGFAPSPLAATAAAGGWRFAARR